LGGLVKIPLSLTVDLAKTDDGAIFKALLTLETFETFD
jgi:hypothetical protein